jgi:REP element-mobilizing transposase RayT
MSATPRDQHAGCIYHVTSRGNLRALIFLCDEDRARFLGLVERACVRDDLICHAYCLMGNHYHLLVETPRANLGAAMHRINRGYARQFNIVHEREGHVFERRYRSWIMRGSGRQMEAARYIVRNPVRAGLCGSPDEWPWSSHRATAGLCPPPPFLSLRAVHAWFSSPGTDPAAAYGAFVAAGVDAPKERPPLDVAIGAGTLEEIAVANRELGYPLREIAALVGVSAATLSRRLRRETSVPGTGVSRDDWPGCCY